MEEAANLAAVASASASFMIAYAPNLRRGGQGVVRDRRWA
jgi:hypothetical protein